jgi:hypothetical protein
MLVVRSAPGRTLIEPSMLYALVARASLFVEALDPTQDIQPVICRSARIEANPEKSFRTPARPAEMLDGVWLIGRAHALRR